MNTCSTRRKQSDYYLQNNDILYVPFIGDLVEVKGSVKQVGVFEMKEKETFSELTRIYRRVFERCIAR